MSERLHATFWGLPDGAPLLLGGSLGTVGAMWERQAPLGDAFRLIAFDHRGHGQSPVPPEPYEIGDLGRDVLALMDELGLERAAYCGVSLGGMVGLWLGAHAPDRLAKLIVMGAAAHLPPPSAWQERAAAVREAGSVEPLADAIVDRWLTSEGAAREPETRAWLRGMLAASDPAGYAACCGAIERMDLREDLRAIGVPTLVISGAEDPSVPLVHQEAIAAAVPGAQHEVVANAAHLPSVERPAEINLLIRGFLTG